MLRFAPSPNGALHLGHALSALFGADLALRLGGRFRVRIEDIDPARSRPEHVAGIFRDLAWLGVGWEEPVVHQSTRIEAYRAAAARLDAMGLLYPCFASRAEIAAVAGGEVDPDGAPLYPGLWRHAAPNAVAVRLASGAPHVMRLDMTAAIAEARRRSRHGAELGFIELAEGVIERRECRPERWGDVVLQRKDTPTSYHLAVVVDDAHEGITHVTRGRDLLAATDVHRLLQVLLELPEPVYVHHRLMTDSDGRKLSKSARDTSLASLRAAGVTPEEVRRMVGLHDGGDVAQQLQRIVHLPG